MTPEEYIKAYTRGCSNELVHGGYHEWLTPENALAAVELAREEVKKDAIYASKLTWQDIQHILDIDDLFIKEKLVDTGRLPNNSKAYCKRILAEFKKWKNQQSEKP